MGSVGSSTTPDISSYKWKVSKRYRYADEAVKNISEALTYMTRNFGDLSNEIGEIQVKYFNFVAEHDPDGDREGYVATRFSTDTTPRTDTAIHEFTHAITETISKQYAQLGYNSRVEVLNAIADDLRKAEGLSPKTWGRKEWANRSEEYISNAMQFGYKKDNNASLGVLKKWWKKIGR